MDDVQLIMIGILCMILLLLFGMLVMQIAMLAILIWLIRTNAYISHTTTDCAVMLENLVDDTDEEETKRETVKGFG